MAKKVELTSKKRGNHPKGNGKSLKDFKQDSDNQTAIQNSTLDSVVRLKKKRLETEKTVDY